MTSLAIARSRACGHPSSARALNNRTSELTVGSGVHIGTDMYDCKVQLAGHGRIYYMCLVPGRLRLRWSLTFGF